MNYVDIILIALLLLGVWRGFSKGLVIAVFSTLALFVGIYGGIHFSDRVAALLTEHLAIRSNYLPFVAFIITFLGLIIGIHLAGKALTKVLKVAMLGTLNKLAGALFGLARAALILSVALLIVHPLNERIGLINASTYNQSVLYLPMYHFASTLIPAIVESDFYAYVQSMEWVPEGLLKSE
jgi:membrane protein required for colicin V production